MRFQITWTEGQYKVSVPNYEGGEVVTAEYHDQCMKELEQRLEVERKLRSIDELSRERDSKLADLVRLARGVKI